MKKIILALVFVVLVATPWFIGLGAKSRIDDFAQHVDSLPGYAATLESYEVGYLDSAAVLNVSFDSTGLAPNMTPEERAEMAAFFAGVQNGWAFKLNIRHGPFLGQEEQSMGLFHAELALQESSAALESFKDRYGIASLLDTKITMGFGGSGQVVMAAPPFEMEEETGRVTFGGFDYRADLRNWGTRYEGRGELHETIGTIAATTFKLAPMTIDMQGELAGGFLTGTGAFNLAMEGLDVVGASSFSFEGLTLAATATSPTPATMDIAYRYGLRNLSSSDMEYPLQDLVINASLLNIDRQAMQETFELLMDDTLDAAAQQQQMMELVDRAYGSAEFRLDEVSFTYGPDVRMLMNATYAFKPGFFTSLGDGTTPPDPFAMMGAMNASMNLDVSQGLIDMVMDMVLRSQMAGVEAPPEQIEQLIELQKAQLALSLPQLVQQGMLNTSTRGYQAEFSLQDGRFMINGNPIPIPGL